MIKIIIPHAFPQPARMRYPRDPAILGLHSSPVNAIWIAGQLQITPCLCRGNGLVYACSGVIGGQVWRLVHSWGYLSLAYSNLAC
jgi:hypothetical protein